MSREYDLMLGQWRCYGHLDLRRLTEHPWHDVHASGMPTSGVKSKSGLIGVKA